MASKSKIKSKYKKNQHLKNEVKNFLDTHRDIEFSAAKFEYSTYLYGEASQKAIEFANSVWKKGIRFRIRENNYRNYGTGGVTKIDA